MQEKTLRSILMVVIFLVALVGISVTLNDRKENKPSNTNSNLEDGRKFKEEYEAYNNKEREDDKGNYFQKLDRSEEHTSELQSP